MTTSIYELMTEMPEIGYYQFKYGPLVSEVDSLFRTRRPLYLKVTDLVKSDADMRCVGTVIAEITRVSKTWNDAHLMIEAVLRDGILATQLGRKIEVALLPDFRRTGLFIFSGQGITLLED